MAFRRSLFGILLVQSIIMPCSMLAGTLGDFEDTVAKPGSTLQSSEDDDSFGEGLFDSMFGDCINTVFEGAVIGLFKGTKWLAYDWWAHPADSSYNHVSATGSPEAAIPPIDMREQEQVVPITERLSESSRSVKEEAGVESSFVEDDDPDGLIHQPGTAGSPYIRFDYRWQYLENNLDANDYLMELGYSFFALYGRNTRYEDRATDEELEIGQYYGMLRLGGIDEFFSSAIFEVGFGVGGYVIDGARSQSGIAATLPIMYYPSDWCGIEFRPAWASINEKTISDYDVSFSLGQRYIHLRAGYRWLWVQGDGHWLNGPYAGVSAMF